MNTGVVMHQGCRAGLSSSNTD